jgi:ABC-type transporter Mla MlaB component
MEELLELRQLLEQGKIHEALVLVDELEEMSLSDKINKIDSYGVILLIHLIKQKAEKRSTRSWDVSIENTVREINKINKRRKSGGVYLNPSELMDILQQGYQVALKRAALEAFEGRYEAQELAAMVDREDILSEALKLIQQ